MHRFDVLHHRVSKIDYHSIVILLIVPEDVDLQSIVEVDFDQDSNTRNTIINFGLYIPEVWSMCRMHLDRYILCNSRVNIVFSNVYLLQNQSHICDELCCRSRQVLLNWSVNLKMFITKMLSILFSLINRCGTIINWLCASCIRFSFDRDRVINGRFNG